MRKYLDIRPYVHSLRAIQTKRTRKDTKIKFYKTVAMLILIYRSKYWVDTVNTMKDDSTNRRNYIFKKSKVLHKKS